MEGDLVKDMNGSGEPEPVQGAGDAHEAFASSAPASPLPSLDASETPPESPQIETEETENNETLSAEAKGARESTHEMREEPNAPVKDPSSLPTHNGAHLDPRFLDSLEKNATKLAQELHLVLAKLQGDMHDVIHNTALHLEVHKSASYSLAEQVEHSIASLKALMIKCRTLNNEFAGVRQLHAQIADVKKVVAYLDSRVSQIRAPKGTK